MTSSEEASVSREGDGKRVAEVAHVAGDSAGACLFLTLGELECLGIDPEADAIEFHVDEATGELVVEEVFE